MILYAQKFYFTPKFGRVPELDGISSEIEVIKI